MTNQQKMVVTDLDGTLLNSEQKIHANDWQTLLLLKEQNILRVIASGRCIHSAKRVLPATMPIDFFIFSTGAAIYDWNNKKIIHQVHFKQIEVKRIVDYLLNFPYDFCIQNPLPDNHYFKYLKKSKQNNDLERRCALYKGYIEQINNPAKYEPTISTHIIIIEPKEKGANTYLKIKNDLPENHVVRTTSPIDHESVWIEIFPKSVSKSSGIFYLAKQFNISLNNIMVVGNDYNDIDMLEKIRDSYVVENAPDILKKHKVVPSNNNAGFSYAVNDWLSNS